MSVLAQGLTPHNPIAVAYTWLPSPRDKLDEAPSTSGPMHPFILPPNREGQAAILRPVRQPIAATMECLIAPAPTAPGVVQPISAPGSLLGTLILNLDMIVSMVILSSAASTSGAGLSLPAPAADAPVSRYTQRNRSRRALEKESAGSMCEGLPLTRAANVGSPKPEFGHSRYGNATFCSRASNVKSLDDWLAEQHQQNKGQTAPPQ